MSKKFTSNVCHQNICGIPRLHFWIACCCLKATNLKKWFLPQLHNVASKQHLHFTKFWRRQNKKTSKKEHQEKVLIYICYVKILFSKMYLCFGYLANNFWIAFLLLTNHYQLHELLNSRAFTEWFKTISFRQSD